MQIGPRAYLAIAFLGVGLGACGSSSNSTHAPASADQSAKAQIKKNWVDFFSPSTSATTKATLLQNGQQFAPIIETLFKLPLAKGLSANVSDVTLTGPTTAKVTYTLSLAGQPVLNNSTGTAVKSGGTWLVGDASFCQLLKLEGSSPPVCPKG
jgi:hypothetical protein